MAFPASPLNNQIATVNGINYQYVSADNVWKRVAPGFDSIVANSLSITGNASITYVAATGFYWANGAPFASSSYGNTDVSAYLSSYFTYANSNATTQATSITTIDANLGAYQIWSNANAASQQTTINSIHANLGAYQLYGNTSINTLTSNAAAQAVSINTINANIGAYQIYANANASSQTSAIDLVNANLSSFQIWANTNYSTGGGSSYGNASVAGYLPMYGGNILAAYITTTNGIFWSNGTAYSSGGGGGGGGGITEARAWLSSMLFGG